ncbi:MAG: hypothetical protein R3186_01070 [Ruegeria sp.]|nr:hypothetical protein [Ruegeria sp.]
MRSFLFLLGLLVLTAQSAVAATRAEIDALFDLLSMDTMLEVMQQEGIVYSDDLANELLPGGTNPAWQTIARRIHDPERMSRVLRAEFDESLGDVDAAPLLNFFSSETGREIVALELAARRAFIDQGFTDAALEAFRAQEEPFDAHFDAIRGFVEANDLIEYNLSGALNSNYMFFRGLAEGGAINMSDEDILAQVWAGEEMIRADTTEWLYAFLMVAYEPLSVETLNAYVALSRSPSGRALNRALFAGFDQMYQAISLSLGLALARQLRGETL